MAEVEDMDKMEPLNSTSIPRRKNSMTSIPDHLCGDQG